MTYLPAFAVLASLAAVMLLLLAGVRPRLAILLALLLTAAAYLAATEPLGHAKPARIEILHDIDESDVQWYSASETEGIHVLLAGPRLYSLPWSERLARELHEASRKAEAEGGTVRLGEPRDGTAGGKWSAGWAPPPTPVPKG